MKTQIKVNLKTYQCWKRKEACDLPSTLIDVRIEQKAYISRNKIIYTCEILEQNRTEQH